MHYKGRNLGGSLGLSTGCRTRPRVLAAPFPTAGAAVAMPSDSFDFHRQIEHAALSDVGLRRSNNQDSFKVAVAGSEEGFQQRGHLFVVADGMGAHAAGELASKLAVDNIPLTYQKLRDKPAPLALKHAVEAANQMIFQRGQANPDFQGMGTTASALVLLPKGAVVAHVGDSRVYRLRGTRLEQLSFDHSLVWELTGGKQDAAKNLGDAIPKNIITRSLGPNAAVEVDLEGPYPVAPGDTFLLCSDGLSGEIEDEEIGAILQCLPPSEAVEVLVDLANLRGGPDNITVIVVRAKAALAADVDEPYPVALRSDKQSVHPAVWGLLAGGLLFAAAVGALVNWMAGLGVAAAGIAVAGLLHWRLQSGERTKVPAGQLGRGPYRSWECPPTQAIVSELASVLEQLRAAAVDEDWTIDWSRLEELKRTADQAAARRDFPTAARGYSHAVQFMVREIKKDRGRLGEIRPR